MYTKAFIDEILTFLFDGYKEESGKGSLFPVKQIILKHSQNPKEVVHYLANTGLVYPCMNDNGEYKVGITMPGISMINPAYISDNTTKIISTLSILENQQMRITEILGLDQIDRQLGFDLANYLHKEGIVNIVREPDGKDMLVSLTRKGRTDAEKGKPVFFN